MYTIEVLDSIEQFRKLEPVWNGLVARSDADLPFMTYEWFSCWWKIYGKDGNLLILIIRENGAIAAIAPFMRSRTWLRGVPVEAVSFIDNYHAFRLGLVMLKQDSGILSTVFRYFRENRYRHDVLFLRAIEKNSATDGAIRHVLLTDGIPFIEYPSDRSPYIPVTGSWEDYLESRSKNFRKRFRNLTNRFQRLSSHEIVHCTGPETDDAVDDVLYISKNSWKFGGNTALASSRRQSALYRELARAAAAKGFLDLWLLKLSGEPIAFAFNLRLKRRLFGLKVGYHEKYGHLSPGKFLDYTIVRDCFESSCLEYDLMGKDEPYKMEWTDSFRTHCKYLIFNNTFSGKLLYPLESLVIPKIKSIVGGVTSHF